MTLARVVGAGLIDMHRYDVFAVGAPELDAAEDAVRRDPHAPNFLSANRAEDRAS